MVTLSSFTVAYNAMCARLPAQCTLTKCQYYNAPAMHTVSGQDHTNPQHLDVTPSRDKSSQLKFRGTHSSACGKCSVQSLKAPPACSDQVMLPVELQECAGGAMAPKQMCQIFQALLMLQLKSSSMPLFVQPPALLQLCKQVSECACLSHKQTQQMRNQHRLWCTCHSCAWRVPMLLLTKLASTVSQRQRNTPQAHLATCMCSSVVPQWTCYQSRVPWFCFSICSVYATADDLLTI